MDDRVDDGQVAPVGLVVERRFALPWEPSFRGEYTPAVEMGDEHPPVRASSETGDAFRRCRKRPEIRELTGIEVGIDVLEQRSIHHRGRTKPAEIVEDTGCEHRAGCVVDFPAETEVVIAPQLGALRRTAAVPRTGRPVVPMRQPPWPWRPGSRSRTTRGLVSRATGAVSALALGAHNR